jgi:POT family proton-dependent oligopeptide transporter
MNSSPQVDAEQRSLLEIRNFQGTYPRQIWFLFMIEMWERFCFYGMRGMLMVFMVSPVGSGGLGLGDGEANLQYGSIQSFVYAFTFLGGLVADRFLGFRKSLFWGSVLMCIGGILMGMNPVQNFYLGICFNIIGSGFFKPNISTMVGQLYHENDSRRDAGFSLFYAGINIGAFLGGSIMILVARNYGWSQAFYLVAVSMLISLIIFLLTRTSFGPIGLSPLRGLKQSRRLGSEILIYAVSLLAIVPLWSMIAEPRYNDRFMAVIGPLTLLYLSWEMRTLTRQENLKLGAALIFILFSVFFWAFFEQSGGSLSQFALYHLQGQTLWGIPMDANAVNNSANAFFVIALAPLLGMFWVWTSKRQLEPHSMLKFALAFLLLGLAFVVFYLNRFVANSEGLASLEIFVLAYLIISLGELCLSPIGLSLMTKLSPLRMQGLVMGLWFLASAYGQYAAGLLGAGMSLSQEGSSVHDKLMAYTQGYLELGIYAFVAGVLLWLLHQPVRRMMQGVH